MNAFPNVDLLLSGMSSMQQLLENTEYVSRLEPLSQIEMNGVLKMVEENKRLSELYCIKDYAKKCYSEVGTG